MRVETIDIRNEAKIYPEYKQRCVGPVHFIINIPSMITPATLTLLENDFLELLFF